MTQRLAKTAAILVMTLPPLFVHAGPVIASAGQQDGSCHLDPAYLPHTADAIEGWFAQCRREHGHHRRQVNSWCKRVGSVSQS
jgi:hypothetical protein